MQTKVMDQSNTVNEHYNLRFTLNAEISKGTLFENKMKHDPQPNCNKTGIPHKVTYYKYQYMMLGWFALQHGTQCVIFTRRHTFREVIKSTKPKTFKPNSLGFSSVQLGSACSTKITLEQSVSN